MHLFKRLWGHKANAHGLIALSFMPQGIAVAVSRYQSTNVVHLTQCEFIPILDKTEQSSALAQWVTAHKLSGFDCHVVLTREDCRRFNIEAPAVPEYEMTEAIRWKINELIDFPVDNAVIDYFAAPTSARAANAKMLEVVVSPHDLIQATVQRCQQAGLNVKVIDIQETCLRNLAMLLPENSRGVAVLYLQERSGSLLIQKEGVIYLSRKFESGYRALNLEQQAEQVSPRSDVANNLILEIQRSLDYVESYFGIPPITSLAVVPMAQATQELLQLLNSQYGITARIMDVSAIVESDNVMDDTLQSLCMPAIGAMFREEAATQ